MATTGVLGSFAGTTIMGLCNAKICVINYYKKKVPLPGFFFSRTFRTLELNFYAHRIHKFCSSYHKRVAVCRLSKPRGLRVEKIIESKELPMARPNR